jgi:hypothetical protein
VKQILILITLSAFLAVACTTASVANQANNANAAAEATPASSGQGSAGGAQMQTAPDALVADLYKQHDAKKSPFFQSKDRALVDKYFAKSLADMIWKDATRKNQNEVGVLDGDPLYNAQDTEIKNFKVGAADVKSDKATVVVTFDNFGAKQTLKFSLAQEKNAWKISDIDYGEAGTLVKWFKEGDGSETATVEHNFSGKYQVGDTSCTVKPIKMAFEVHWTKGSGVETFFSNDGENNSFSSETKDGGFENTFAFDNDNYDKGKFMRADGKEFAVRRIK